jgi:hypothetical protein
MAVMTALFAHDQTVITEDENTLCRAFYVLSRISGNYNVRISTYKTKVLAFQGKKTVRAEVQIEDKTVKQANSVKYLNYDSISTLK